jgi:hypothetical protein
VASTWVGTNPDRTPRVRSTNSCTRWALEQVLKGHRGLRIGQDERRYAESDFAADTERLATGRQDTHGRTDR